MSSETSKLFNTSNLKLTWNHIILLTLSKCLNTLYYKSWFTFSGFLHNDFNISYSNLAYIIAFGNLGTKKNKK